MFASLALNRPGDLKAEGGVWVALFTNTNDDKITITDWRYYLIPEPDVIKLFQIGGVGAIQRRIIG